MKTSFYAAEEIGSAERKMKASLWLGVAFAFLSSASFALAIALSTYETKLLWMVFGCSSCLVCFSFSFLFFAQWKRRSNSLALYRKVLEEEGEVFEGKLLSIEKRPIILANGYEAYPLEVEISREEKKVFYLSSDKRDAFPFEIGRIYSFRVVSLYVKEVFDA